MDWVCRNHTEICPKHQQALVAQSVRMPDYKFKTICGGQGSNPTSDRSRNSMSSLIARGIERGKVVRKTTRLPLVSTQAGKLNRISFTLALFPLNYGPWCGSERNNPFFWGDCTNKRIERHRERGAKCKNIP